MRNFSTFGAVVLGVSCTALTIVIGATPLAAQDAPVGNIPSGTMAGLARHVVEFNPDVVAQRQQVRIAKARLESAEAGYLPTIQASGLVQRREIDVKKGGAGDSEYTAGQASIEARLRFYDGNRTYNAVKIAKAELQAAEAGLQGTASDILLELLTSAADIHLNRKILEYSQAQSDAIGEQLRATERRLEFGEATRTDQELARARLATSEAGVLAATEQLNVTSYRFRSVSGLSGTATPPLPSLAAIPGSLGEAQRIASENAPRLRAARLNAQAGKSGVNFASGALLPQLDAVSGYEYLTGGVANLFTGKLPKDRSSLYYGVELNVPIFQPRDHAEVRRARAVRDQRLTQANSAERTVAEEVGSYWTQWQSAKSTIAAAETAVASIEKAAEGIKKEAVGGNRTLTDVLNAQNELLSARVTLERARRAEFVARAGLLAAIGQLDTDAIVEGRCCAGDPITRPDSSRLGKPVIAAAPEAAPLPEAAAARPQRSALGKDVRLARIDKVPPPVDAARPGASTLGRRPD